jgi:hypothetical protein
VLLSHPLVLRSRAPGLWVAAALLFIETVRKLSQRRKKPPNTINKHQNTTSTRQTRADRANGNAEDLRYLLISHAFQPDEQDDLALFRWQFAQGSFEIAQLQGGDGVGRGGQSRCDSSIETVFPSRTERRTSLALAL